jgi:hypothetical protein
MDRTWQSSFAGAGVGFLVGVVLVQMMARSYPDNDTTAVTLFVGVFLAGAGAVAGAVTGGAADLLEFLKRRDEAERDAPETGESESRP